MNKKLIALAVAGASIAPAAMAQTANPVTLYGRVYATRIVALMLLAIPVAALLVSALFSAAGLIPGGARPTRADVFGSVRADYKLVLNALGLLVFAALFALTVRRGATDPVCGMRVDRAKALRSDRLGGA